MKQNSLSKFEANGMLADCMDYVLMHTVMKQNDSTKTVSECSLIQLGLQIKWWASMLSQSMRLSTKFAVDFEEHFLKFVS